MKKLTIVIVNYNVKLLLEQLLRSLRKAVDEVDVEIIVVDNHSPDCSVEYLSPLFPEVKFIKNSDNKGFSKANNQAIEASMSEYLLLLNPDTVVGEMVLKESLAYLDNNPSVGAVGVKMVDAKGNFLPESKRGFPSPWVSFCKIFGLSKLFPMSKLFGRYHLKYLSEEKVHRVDVLAGAYMMIRREALNRCGLLDERFFMYGEDIDLSYRITQAGYDNVYLPLPIIHYKGESTKVNSLKYVWVFYHAMYLFFKKHYPHYSTLYGLFIVMGIVVRASMAGLRRVLLLPFKSASGKREGSTPLFNLNEGESYASLIKSVQERKRAGSST